MRHRGGSATARQAITSGEERKTRAGEGDRGSVARGAGPARPRGGVASGGRALAGELLHNLLVAARRAAFARPRGGGAGALPARVRALLRAGVVDRAYLHDAGADRVPFRRGREGPLAPAPAALQRLLLQCRARRAAGRYRRDARPHRQTPGSGEAAPQPLRALRREPAPWRPRQERPHAVPPAAWSARQAAHHPGRQLLGPPALERPALARQPRLPRARQRQALVAATPGGFATTFIALTNAL